MKTASHVLDEAVRTVEKIGYDKTIELLQKAQQGEVSFEDKKVEKVIELVAKSVNISAYEILNGNGRKNERKYAIGFCAYYLHHAQFFSMDMDLVKDHLQKDITTCYTYSNLIKKLNPNHFSTKLFYSMKVELDTLFAELLKQHKK
jgi:hypothetical protein